MQFTADQVQEIVTCAVCVLFTCGFMLFGGGR